MERRMGECHQWKANGQCSREDSCSFNHGNNREDLRKALLAWEKVLVERQIRKRAKVASKEIAQIRRVTVGILPHVKNIHLNRDATSATNVCSDIEARQAAQ